MSAPAFGSVGTRLGTTTSTPAFAVPASVASGDIIVVAFFADVSTTTISAFPSGFAAAENSPRTVNAGGTGNHVLHVAWKRASGADSGTYSFTLSASVFVYGNAARYTGAVAAGNPWDSPTATGDSGNTALTTTPDIAVTTAGPDRLLVFAGTNANGDGGTWSPPAGFSERAGGASVTNIEISDLVQAAQGSSGNRHATNTLGGPCGDWMGALIGTTASGPVQGTVSTNRHPGRGPGRARFFQSPRATNAGGNTVNIDGSLVVTANRTATVSVDHTVAGSLTVTANRTATIAVTHTIGGSLTVTANRTASITRVANIAGSLVITAGRTATIAVTHTVGGSLVVTVNRTATVAVTHTISGTRVTTVNRTATVAVTHTVAGTRPITVGLSATVAVTHTISGTRVTTVNRVATVAVTHTISGTRVITVGLLGSVSTVINGSLTETVNRTATITVTHTVAATRPITVGLSADITVVSGGGANSSMFLPFF